MNLTGCMFEWVTCTLNPQRRLLTAGDKGEKLAWCDSAGHFSCILYTGFICLWSFVVSSQASVISYSRMYQAVFVLNGTRVVLNHVVLSLIDWNCSRVLLVPTDIDIYSDNILPRSTISHNMNVFVSAFNITPLSVNNFFHILCLPIR